MTTATDARLADRTGATVRVTFWGPLTDAVSVPERDIAVELGATPRDIAAMLADADRTLGDALGAKGVLVMADDVLVEWDTDISLAQEVAFMSPMSGG